MTALFRVSSRTSALVAASSLLISGLACSSEPVVEETSARALMNRAYVVSLESDELTVIDLDRLEVIAKVPTGGIANHMAELSGDFTKVYVDSSETDEAVVVDATKLEVAGRISVGRHPTHLSLSRDGKTLAIMAEGEDAVSFVDTTTDREVKRLPGFRGPHFMRWAPDGESAFVANIGAHHLTRVNAKTLEIEETIALDGFEGEAVEAPNEGGFADAQIASDGMLYAAHAATGRVLVYDTKKKVKLPEVAVGRNPWIVFAEHPFKDLPRRHLGPNFGDRTVSLIDGDQREVVATLPGDAEAYGVNYSSLSPGRAFVMNRVLRDVSVVDVEQGVILNRIPVGGNTETAATTPDGKWIVAAVSSANRVVVIDAQTEEVVKIFEDVGQYPWSVTIPLGQNYCH